jgi:hypothetical protein
VLHIVKNYTGDVMNFEMAAEMVNLDTGTEVRAVVTNDDVAVTDSLYTAGRRGVGVTVLLEKMVGAAAEQGTSLAECHGARDQGGRAACRPRPVTRYRPPGPAGCGCGRGTRSAGGRLSGAVRSERTASQLIEQVCLCRWRPAAFDP